MTTSRALLLLSLTLACACRNAAPEPPAAQLPPGAEAHSAPAPRDLPPNHPPMGQMPAGHPPMGQMPAGHPAMGGAGMEAPAPSGRELHWTDPVGWRRVQPSSSMRRAQYAIPGPAGSEDAELAVFWFGAGQGGSIDENIRRWHGQFAQDGAAAAAPPPTQDRTVHGLRVHLTERFGRFAGGMGMPGAAAPSPRDDWGMLGAIVETDQGPWFFKMTGPRTTVNAARPRFEDLVASVQMP
jgi:hypothetical protein